MVLATRRRTRVVLALLALVAAAALVDGVRLWRTAQNNALIASRATIAEAPGQPPELRFAQAAAFAASGARDAALNRYRALQPDPRLGAAARYNSANLLVRQALEVRGSTQPGQAIALLELAKENYRDVLRDDPTQWDARYNLERALALAPEADDEDAQVAEPPANKERTVTTARVGRKDLP